MHNKIISVTISILSSELPSGGTQERTFPQVEAALSEGYTVKEVIGHQNEQVANYLFVLEKIGASKSGGVKA